MYSPFGTDEIRISSGPGSRVLFYSATCSQQIIPEERSFTLKVQKSGIQDCKTEIHYSYDGDPNLYNYVNQFIRTEEFLESTRLSDGNMVFFNIYRVHYTGEIPIKNYKFYFSATKPLVGVVDGKIIQPINFDAQNVVYLDFAPMQEHTVIQIQPLERMDKDTLNTFDSIEELYQRNQN